MTKLIKIFIPVFIFVLLIFAYVTPFVETSEKISESVFRLHILANSDTKEDQTLKLLVRDEVLREGQQMFADCSTLEEIINLSKSNSDYFAEKAKKCVQEHGYNYDVKVYVDKEYFNTRKYDTITLPGGFYNALKIEIGEAKGHNWWCVMFPAICLSAVSDDEINKVLDEDEIALINTDNRYEIRFKIVEIYEKLKKQGSVKQ